MKKTVIKRMVIELDGKDVELTMDQARELQAALNELFGEKVREIVKPMPYPVPEPYPVTPFIPWRRRPYWPRPEPFWISRSGSRFGIDSGGTMRCRLKAGGE